MIAGDEISEEDLLSEIEADLNAALSKVLDKI